MTYSILTVATCLFFVSVFSIIQGCGPSQDEIENQMITGNDPGTMGWQTVVYDSCEYVQNRNGFAWHKGNCKNHKK